MTMVIHSDLSRIKTLLTEALTVLCKNGLKYRSELCIEGLLGITLDNQDIFLVNINEKLVQTSEGSDKNKSAAADHRNGNASSQIYPQSDLTSSGQITEDKENRNKTNQNFHSVNTEELFRKSGHSIDTSLSQGHHGSDLRPPAEPKRMFPSSDTQNDNDSNPNPLNLIIKREELSDSEAVEEIGEISRIFNITRPRNSVKQEQQAQHTVTVIPEKTDSGTEVNTLQDNKSLNYGTSDKVSETSGWTSGLVPYCSNSNLVSDPHFFALTPSPLTQAFPLFSPSLINQYNIGIQLPAMDNQLSQTAPSRPPVLSAGRNLVCQFCAKVVRTNQALRDHIATHEQRKRYQCQNCDLQFVHRSSLANHRRKCFPSVSPIQAEWFHPKEEKT